MTVPYAQRTFWARVAMGPENTQDARRKGRLIRVTTLEGDRVRERTARLQAFWAEKHRGLMVRNRCGACGEKGHTRPTCHQLLNGREV